MDCNLYCLVDEGGHVYVKDGAASYSDVAASFGRTKKMIAHF